MSDAGFVVAAYGVIFGGLGLYVVMLWRRLRTAREVSLRIRHDAAWREEPPRDASDEAQ